MCTRQPVACYVDFELELCPVNLCISIWRAGVNAFVTMCLTSKTFWVAPERKCRTSIYYGTSNTSLGGTWSLHTTGGYSVVLVLFVVLTHRPSNEKIHIRSIMPTNLKRVRSEFLLDLQMITEMIVRIDKYQAWEWCFGNVGSFYALLTPGFAWKAKSYWRGMPLWLMWLYCISRTALN